MQSQNVTMHAHGHLPCAQFLGIKTLLFLQATFTLRSFLNGFGTRHDLWMPRLPIILEIRSKLFPVMMKHPAPTRFLLRTANTVNFVNLRLIPTACSPREHKE